MRSNINVQELTVEALISQDRQYVYHAAMMDPHTGAELDLEQIWLMVDDLLEAHKDWLPEFYQKRLMSDCNLGKRFELKFLKSSIPYFL